MVLTQSILDLYSQGLRVFFHALKAANESENGMGSGSDMSLSQDERAKEYLMSNLERAKAAKQQLEDERAAEVPLPSVGRIVHYYGKLMVSSHTRVGPTCDVYIPPSEESGPFAALVIDVGPGPRTVTLKITDYSGGDHVRANVEYGDPGWTWPPRV